MELSRKNFRSPFEENSRILELPFRILSKETPGVQFYTLLVLVIFPLSFFFFFLLLLAAKTFKTQHDCLQSEVLPAWECGRQLLLLP